ncbi:MAG: APC family permease [Planctomycetota bacterium]|nr:APC family permease [Planctomycetota bacterium]
MHTNNTPPKPLALTLLSSQRPRDVGWVGAAGLLFGDWGTSRLYVLGLALFFAGRTSFWLIVMMSLLILGVAWAYSQICRIYPDGGGVYTAAKHTSQTLAVVGALLLFADYTVTASLSVLDAFHYFGLPINRHVEPPEHQASGAAKASSSIVRIADQHYDTNPNIDAGNMLDTKRASPPSATERFLAFDSPGLWAIVTIAVIGLFNMLGPKHTGGFAIIAAVGMIFITLLISASALPQVPWHDLPHRIGRPDLSHPGPVWVAFVSIVLALSGVEAIANLTGVMRQPVQVTARKAIWAVAAEVALLNIVLAICMLAIFPINRDAHLEDMAAFLTAKYVGTWGELTVRMVGGLLLLSAGNTAIAGMTSIQYLMARDNELPAPLVRLNRFGVPWIAAVIAAAVPIIVLIISHNLDQLAALYAIGVIGAVAINICLCAFHPRLRKLYRKIPMALLGIILIVIWVTLAYVKREALLFVTVVMILGLSARQINKIFANRKGARPSLLRQAIMQQLGGNALERPRVLVGTYGSDALARPALNEAKRAGATLIVCFIRSVRLSYNWDRALSMDTDIAALKTFARFLALGHEMGVPVLPVYDSGENAAELMAEAAAVTGCDRVFLGSSRQGAIFNFIKGDFQQRLESLLPPEITVEVLRPQTIAEAQPAEKLVL